MNEKPKHGCSYASFSLLFALLSFLSLPAIINAQTVTGKVADESGKSLGSVSVVVKGSSTGTITDASGQYTITAAPDATLLFSSIGFLNYEVSVAGRSIINVTLTSNEKSLNEVVITALGIRKQQRGLGYSATNVNPQELTVNRTPNPVDALQGKIAGVNISTLGTGPGSTSKIRIRGQSSLGGGSNR